jgi:hypothetical protein
VLSNPLEKLASPEGGNARAILAGPRRPAGVVPFGGHADISHASKREVIAS